MIGLGFFAVCAVSGAIKTPAVIPTEVKGTVLRIFQERMILGREDGSVAGFDVETGKRAWSFAGGSTPVIDVVRIGTRTWWACKDSNVLHTVSKAREPQAFDLSAYGITGPVRRLSIWNQELIVHTDNQIRFINSKTEVVRTPEEALPKDVARLVSQGVVVSNWFGKSGLIMSIRRYGMHTKLDEEGQIPDIADIKAWKFDERGKYQRLGGYTCSLTRFRDAEGPEVNADQAGIERRFPFGTCDVGNIQVGPEGVIALARSQALLVPFVDKNYDPSWQKLAVAPDYAQMMTFSESTVSWWANGKLVQGSLEDGDCTVYQPRNGRTQVLGIATGSYQPKGSRISSTYSWVLTNEGLVKFNSGSLGNAGFFGYRVNQGSIVAESKEQKKAQKALQQLNNYASLASSKPSLNIVKQVLNDMSFGKRFDVAPRTSSVEYGDVVRQRGQYGFYVGNGELMFVTARGAERVPMEISDDLAAFRVLRPDYVPRRGRPQFEYTPDGRPYSGSGIRLENGIVVSVRANEPGDKPRTAAQQAIAAELQSWLGTPYVWGGSSRSGTDCSGFISSIYRHAGLSIPRHSQDMGRSSYGANVTDTLRYGDILVQRGHVRMYIGNGKCAEAIRPAVCITNLQRGTPRVVKRFIP